MFVFYGFTALLILAFVVYIVASGKKMEDYDEF